MAFSRLFKRHSIGARIFAACVAMGLITGALGLYGFYVLSAAGNIAVKTYDGPLMAINFARSASLSFAQMNNEVLRRATVSRAKRREVDDNLDELADSLSGDLDVVEKRSVSSEQRLIIAQLRSLIAEWMRVQKAASRDQINGDLNDLGASIFNRFDTLVELTADYSFVDRRKAVWSVSYFRYSSIGALVLALLLTGIITLLLARRIVPPLSQAASVADRIARGELHTPIPAGGRDETGVLLRSMTVMQENIRAMMEREQQERQSAQRRMVDAVEGSREGVVLVDADGRIVIANSQVAQFCPTMAPYMVPGESFAEAFSRVRLAFAWQTDFREADLDRAFLNPADDEFSVGEYQMADGRWLRVSRSATREGGFILFVSDFTEIKEREELFKQAKLQADAANRSKTNFLANMSHELRTPLNAIIGFSEIIANQQFGPGNPKYPDYARDILRSGEHLLSIINSVLDLAKTEAGKVDLAAEPVDISAIIDECETMMRTQCEKAGLRFAVEKPPGRLWIHGEPAKLRQIVLNLLSNALKFTATGGTISLASRLSADGDVEIEIGDTGIGMTATDIEIAMTPFGQVESALARKFEGTGLGLPLTAAFVELHGGRLHIDSEPGRGTRVIVTLPRPIEEPVPCRPTAA
ncbi:MAG: HAMP domain-containing protein [Alphaproteobacteria bacterium]|nr:HAMP domain-containing protein [Alphaproteobacteria bacterium]